MRFDEKQVYFRLNKKSCGTGIGGKLFEFAPLCFQHPEKSEKVILKVKLILTFSRFAKNFKLDRCNLIKIKITKIENFLFDLIIIYVSHSLYII